MQNIPLEKVAETGTLSLGYDVGLLQGFVDRDDLAKIISIVLKDPETHHRARYEILGVNNTHEEVANYVGKRLGKEIKAKKIGLDKFVQAAKEGGRPAPQGSYGLEANKYCSIAERVNDIADLGLIQTNAISLRGLLSRSWYAYKALTVSFCTGFARPDRKLEHCDLASGSQTHRLARVPGEKPPCVMAGGRAQLSEKERRIR